MAEPLQLVRCSCGETMLLGASGWVCPACPAKIIPDGGAVKSVAGEVQRIANRLDRCSACAGTGAVECSKCSGSGSVECGECGHSCEAEDECEECGGDGDVECDVCSGSGRSAAAPVDESTEKIYYGEGLRDFLRGPANDPPCPQ